MIYHQQLVIFSIRVWSHLKDLVGEENIILAQIHYDEDTPHLQAYFLPIVNEVKRKCFVKDKDGNVVKEDIKEKMVVLVLHLNYFVIKMER